MKKTTIAVAVGIVIGGASMGANAALTSGATLSFTTQGPTTLCNYGTTPPCNKAGYTFSDVVGSYFSMDNNKDGIVAPGEKTGISSFNGIILGASGQDATGSHSGGINGTEGPNIDSPWEFFGNTGMHQTAAGVSVSGAGTTRTIDLSSWSVTWNCLDPIPLLQQGAATITCSTASCSDSSAYTVDGAWHVAGAGFTSVNYTLHLEGKITDVSAVPVPAAVWLFGSGLLGLVGVARRRKNA